jgi:hypothetical protein
MYPVLRWSARARLALGLPALLLLAGTARAQGGDDEARAKLLALKKKLPELVAKSLNVPPPLAAPKKDAKDDKAPKDEKPPVLKPPGPVLVLPGAATRGWGLPAPKLTAADVKVVRRISPSEARIKFTLTVAGYRWLARPLLPSAPPPGRLPAFQGAEGTFAPAAPVTEYVTLRLRYHDGAWTTTGFDVSWDRARTTDSQEASRLLALERRIHKLMLEIDELGGE